jgi:hypothetical protein
MFKYRMELQRAEACGSVNRWFCSQAYGRPVFNEEMLVCYYIKSGGAANFAQRYDEAMGQKNRWYCSEFYGREICDPKILWNYYITHAFRHIKETCASAELNMCC